MNRNKRSEKMLLLNNHNLNTPYRPTKRKRDDRELEGAFEGLRQDRNSENENGVDGSASQQQSLLPRKKKVCREIGERPIWAQSVRTRAG